MGAEEAISETPGGVRIKIRVQPRSSRNKISGLHGGSLKVQLTAPPVDGEANKALLKLLSKLLGIPRAELAITSGQTSRSKTVEARGLTVGQAEERLGLT